jgi:hypothetical protein
MASAPNAPLKRADTGILGNGCRDRGPVDLAHLFEHPLLLLQLVLQVFDLRILHGHACPPLKDATGKVILFLFSSTGRFDITFIILPLFPKSLRVFLKFRVGRDV